MNEVFEKELARLNPAQREAVEHIDGPVLVIAGPGTGKTQILAARIGTILNSPSTQAAAHNILCLTYTDAGAIAMRQRLLKFIGPDAYRVNIHTFHAFCNEVIQDNPDVFGYRNLEPISDLEKIELLNKLIDNLPQGHILKRYSGEVYYERSRLDRLFQIMKQEDWQPEVISTKIDEYLADLPNRDEYIYKRNGKDYKKGDLKVKAIEQETHKMEQLRAGAQLFQLYQEMLQAKGRYDYADMILWVLNAFKTDENILRQYQEQFLYFLVDEFQDTSGAQNELLDLLVNFWEVPNVFAVGDDDQSIYRFQGANVANITEFANKYGEHLKTVVLKDNYRSTQLVLDTSKTLIENNKERLTYQVEGLSKELSAKNEHYASLNTKPEIRAYFNNRHETIGVAKEIEQAYNAGKSLNEIAVIYRNHKQAEEMVKYLEAKGIPLNIKRKTNILEEPLIKKILTILRYVSKETERPNSGEHLLFEILHYDFWDISALEVAKLSMDIARSNFSETKKTWRDELHNVSSRTSNTLFNNNIEHISSIKRLSDDIDYWIKESLNVTVEQIVEKIINRGGILGTVLKQPDKTWNMQLLSTFFNFVKEECSKTPRMKLADLIATFDLMEKDEVSLPLNRIIYAPDGVNFITSHSSKGLEFETVYLIGCTSKAWDKASKSYTYSFPDNLLTSIEKADEAEESRRLFYVALTRAKQNLIISYPEMDEKDKEQEKTRFIAEIENLPFIEKKHINESTEDVLDFEVNILMENEQPEPELIDKEFLSLRTENYSLSATHLNSYLKCPVGFYFDKIIRVPMAKNAAMSFGSAVHYALEQLFKKMLDHPNKQFPMKEELVKFFEWSMRRSEDSFTPVEFDRRMEYGQKLLPDYYDWHINKWNKVVSIERNFRGVEMNGIPINGKLDKLEFDGKAVNVVDYKTGNHERARAKLITPKEGADKEKDDYQKVYGGDYWRQAVFYKILMDNDQSKDWEMVSAEFDFIEPDRKTNDFISQKVVITPQDIETVKDQITYAYNAIKNHEFTQGCGECDWCKFVKYNLKRNPKDLNAKV